MLHAEDTAVTGIVLNPNQRRPNLVLVVASSALLGALIGAGVILGTLLLDDEHVESAPEVPAVSEYTKIEVSKGMGFSGDLKMGGMFLIKFELRGKTLHHTAITAADIWLQESAEIRVLLNGVVPKKSDRFAVMRGDAIYGEYAKGRVRSGPGSFKVTTEKSVVFLEDYTLDEH